MTISEQFSASKIQNMSLCHFTLKKSRIKKRHFGVEFWQRFYFIKTHKNNNMQPTSLAANRAMNESGEKQNHHRKILALLTIIKRGTFGKISAYSGLSYHQVGRRVNELVKAGKVKDSGQLGKSPTGKAAIIWEIVENTK